MADKFWMIADVDCEGDTLEVRKAPRYMHYDVGTAETELLHLQEKYPNGEFVLLEAVAVAERNQGGILVVEDISSLRTDTVDAFRDLIDLWDRIHGTALIGRPTINKIRNVLRRYDAGER